MSAASADAPIGVFDSGVGGLTVLAALRARLPAEDFIYLGDTARLPYGTKSGETVVRYALQAAGALAERGVKHLVVACNTASSVALPALAEAFESLPITGVVEPGAQAACDASRSGHIAVLATEGTVRNGAYQQAILRRRPQARVTAVACQLFVALAEEGWTSGEPAGAIAHRYLDPVFGAADRPDVLVLGCTHFPMLAAAIAAAAGAGVTLVDSAHTTAHAVQRELEAAGLARRSRGALGSQATGTLQLLATDGVERFARVGARFLDMPLTASDVELVDL